MNKIIEIKLQDDTLECKCGNTESMEGFFPCNNEGKEIEPVKGIWNGLYKCGKCGLIYKII